MLQNIQNTVCFIWQRITCYIHVYLELYGIPNRFMVCNYSSAISALEVMNFRATTIYFKGAWESGIELETVSFQKMIPDLLWKWIGMVIINFDNRCRNKPRFNRISPILNQVVLRVFHIRKYDFLIMNDNFHEKLFEWRHYWIVWNICSVWNTKNILWMVWNNEQFYWSRCCW